MAVKKSLKWRLDAGILIKGETPAQWQKQLTASREIYAQVKKSSLTPNTQSGFELDWQIHNPLSEHADNLFKIDERDREVREMISNDVKRAFPEIAVFQKDSVNRALQEILFTWCSMHRDVGYRQGMHEILGIIFLTVKEDSAGPFENELDSFIFDSNAVEHDTFTIFFKLMTMMQNFYDPNPIPREISAHTGSIVGGRFEEKEIPVLSLCRKGQNVYLKMVDPQLHAHLDTLAIEPQLYGLRWLRLLYIREFELNQVLELWDFLFTDFEKLETMAIWISVAMLIQARTQSKYYNESLTFLVLSLDTARVLELLLNYSKAPDRPTAASLIKSAVDLQKIYNIRERQDIKTSIFNARKTLIQSLEDLANRDFEKTRKNILVALQHLSKEYPK